MLAVDAILRVDTYFFPPYVLFFFHLARVTQLPNAFCPPSPRFSTLFGEQKGQTFLVVGKLPLIVVGREASFGRDIVSDLQPPRMTT